MAVAGFIPGDSLLPGTACECHPIAVRLSRESKNQCANYHPQSALCPRASSKTTDYRARLYQQNHTNPRCTISREQATITVAWSHTTVRAGRLAERSAETQSGDKAPDLCRDMMVAKLPSKLPFVVRPAHLTQSIQRVLSLVLW